MFDKSQATAFAVSLLFTPTLFAQESTTAALPEVQVKASKMRSSSTQPDLDTAKARIETVPGGANVVDAETYKNGRVSTLTDALGYAPGVFVQSRFGAEEARLSIRGSGLQRTFHGRGIKVLQDGVPVNLADGSFDFQIMEPLSTRYIEVWRGANALQYGSTTLGGAINFVTPTGLTGPVADARFEAGNFGYRRTYLAAGTQLGNVDFYVSTSDFRQQGFRRHAKQDAQRNLANFGIAINDQLETRFYIAHSESNSELPGSLTKAQLNADPRQANAGTAASNQKRDLMVERYSNKTVYKMSDARFELLTFYSSKNLFHPIFQVIDQDNIDYGADLRYISNADLMGHKNQLTVGFSPTRGRTTERDWVNVTGGRGAQTDASYQVASNKDFYIEDQFYLRPDLALIAGVQYSRAERKKVDQFVPANQANTSLDRAYSHWSPKLGATYAMSPTVQVFGNISGSFEPPTFSETSITPVLFNQAQKATTIEVGTRGQLEQIGWDAVLYRSQIKGEYLSLLAPNGQTTTINADKTVHQGLELGLHGAYRNGVDWRAAALLNDFKFDGDKTYGNNTLPGIPKSLVRAEVGYRFGPGLRAAVNLEAASKTYVDMANSFAADSYSIIGLRLTQDINQNWSWFLEGRNLTDKKYAASVGVVRTMNGVDGAQFLPGDGRSVYAGLRFKI